MDAWAEKVSTPRLGVLDFHPIQYHTPLYRLLSTRGNVELDVLYLDDLGLRPAIDPGFGVPVSWDIDLLSGYRGRFMLEPLPESPAVGADLLAIPRGTAAQTQAIAR
jgi:hypothetical protein